MDLRLEALAFHLTFPAIPLYCVIKYWVVWIGSTTVSLKLTETLFWGLGDYKCKGWVDGRSLR